MRQYVLYILPLLHTLVLPKVQRIFPCYNITKSLPLLLSHQQCTQHFAPLNQINFAPCHSPVCTQIPPLSLFKPQLGSCYRSQSTHLLHSPKLISHPFQYIISVSIFSSNMHCFTLEYQCTLPHMGQYTYIPHTKTIHWTTKNKTNRLLIC